MRAFVVLSLALVGCAHSAEPKRGRAFWVALKEAKFAPPAGTTRAELLVDAVTLVDSEDPVIRDDVGYGLAVQWVYREHALTAAELESFTGTLMKRMGDQKSSVLGRSFSALSLSIVAASETKQPLLSTGNFNALVEAACVELERETDLRGHDPKLGWIHATAHTADLLKFLSRDARLTAAQQKRILGALRTRLDRPDPLAWGEDERLAGPLRSLILRADFDATSLNEWLTALPPKWKALWDAPSLDRNAFLQLNATKQVLRALLITLPADSPSTKPLEEALGALSG